MSNWQFQTVDNNQLTTISELTAHVIYTIRVQALTSVGPGPLSAPVQIKTQQGVPSQPEMLSAADITETTVTLKWEKPAHSAENILSYELYWNDTYSQVIIITCPCVCSWGLSGKLTRGKCGYYSDCRCYCCIMKGRSVIIYGRCITVGIRRQFNTK